MLPQHSLSSLCSNDDSPAPLRCWTEVSRSALRANATAMLARARGATLMAVVKANAYGHGVAGVVPALAEIAAMFGVANPAEAREVAALAPEKPVMILGPVLPEERAAVVAAGFITVVSSAAEAAAFARHGRARVHLAVDTGMGRMGVAEDAALEQLRAMLAVEGIEVAGICSHLPVADEDDEFTSAQLDRFRALVDKARALAGRPLAAHVRNSAGAIGFPEHTPEMIRVGLALYGVSPRAEFQDALLPALTWKSRVVLVRELGPGRSVSYGRTLVIKQPTQVATICTGYADGFPRQTSGRGAQVLVRGRRCPVLGRVTMDQMMVDVTGCGAEPGDEVVLLGRQNGAEIRATELASLAGTIAWDIFTGIGARVTRTFTG